MNTIKTIDIEAKTWFDKVNGNSYFACLITTNYGMSNQISKENKFSPSEYYKEEVFKIPFTYGYGNQFEYEAIKLLKENNILPENLGGYLREYCENNDIILRVSHDTKCLKRELKELVS